MLSLAALTGLLARWRSPGAEAWRIWYLVGLVGLLLALGSRTPLEHLVVGLPVLGDQRLPSRELITVALALAMLLGHFVEDLLGRRAAPSAAGAAADAPPAAGGSEPAAARRAVARRRHIEVASAVAGPAAVLVVVVATVVAARPYGGLLDSVAGSGWTVAAVAPYLAIAAALALAAIVCCASPRASTGGASPGAWRPSSWWTWPRFALNQSSLAPTYASGSGNRTPSSGRSRPSFRPGDRFLVVDPARSAGSAAPSTSSARPTTTSPSSSPRPRATARSISGAVTAGDGHAQPGHVVAASLATATYDRLNVTRLLAVPDTLSVPIGRSEGPSVPTGATPDPVPVATAGNEAVPAVARLTPGSVLQRFFGRSLEVRSVTLHLAPGGPHRAAGLRRLAGSVLVGGVAPVAVSAGATTATALFGSGTTAAALVVRSPLGGPVRIASIVVATPTGRFGLDGSLSAALTAPHWRAAGAIGPFAVFANTRAAGALSGAQGSSAAGGVVLGATASKWTGETDVRVAPAATAWTLRRAVADIPGSARHRAGRRPERRRRGPTRRARPGGHRAARRDERRLHLRRAGRPHRPARRTGGAARGARARRDGDPRRAGATGAGSQTAVSRWPGRGLTEPFGSVSRRCRATPHGGPGRIRTFEG